MPAFERNTNVQWYDGRRNVRGVIKEVHTKPVTRHDIYGKRMERYATEEDPAYSIRRDDGAHFLKSESEVNAAGGD